MIPGSANPLLLTSADSGFAIERSLRFNSSDSAYLNRTPSAAGNQKTWTWSGWFKNSSPLTGTQSFFAAGSNGFTFRISATGAIETYEYSGGFVFHYVTSALFRDPSAWYHIVLAVDTTDSTASDRIKIYVNGSRITDFATSTSPSSGATAQVNNTVQHEIGNSSTNTYLNGYLAEVNFIDGQALAPTDFGEFDDNGVWQPKKFDGSYNQEFAENWESQVTGSAIDAGRAISMTFDGDATTRSAAAAGTTLTFTPTSPITGISAVVIKADRDSGASSSGLVLNGTNISSNWSSGTSEQTISVNNLTSLSWQTETNSQWWGVYYIKVVHNGVTYELLQRPSSTFNSFHLDFADNSSNAALGTDTSGNSNNFTVNNLSAGAGSSPTAKQNFDVVTYTGNGGTQSISSLAFQPDFVWIKARNAGYNHVLFDSVRGTGGAKVLFSNNTSAEGGSSGQEGTVYGHVSAFNSNGFTVAAGTGTPLWVSNSGTNYIAWCWKAGGAASSNTDGTITSSISANASYGFSVVSWTGNSTAGATIGHSLSTAPKMIIVKNRDRSTYGDWVIGHDAINGFQDGNQLYFTSAAVASGEGFFNNTSPTSSVFTVKNNYQVNYSGDNYVAYVWSEVAGFSKFGTYTGNGSTSGPTVTLGFKPRYIILKSTSGSRSWCIYDTARDTNATNDNNLFANNANAESSDPLHNITILDDGFKLSTGNVDRNGSGETYVYAAFAATVPAGGPDADSLVDTPTNAATPTDTGAGGEVVGNYPTLNPLATFTGTLSNGNLKFSTSGGWEPTSATIGVSSGKWYWEYLFEGTNSECGITAHPSNTGYTGNYQGSLGIGNLGDMYYNGTSSNPFSSFASGSIIGMELDLDNGTFRHYVNGVAQSYATQSLDTSLTWFPSGSVYGSSHLTYNFGQRAFAYQNAGTNRPSADFKCLTTANLPEPTIADGSKYFDTTIASGTGASKTFTMPGGFGPGLVWAKQRNGATNHALFDVVRGATKRLVSNATQAEDTQTNQLSAFTSDGFTYGSDIPNASGNTGVYWAWDAGSSNTTIAAGSLNSSVYNQSQSAWQNYLTTTNGNGFPDSNYPVTWAFDGHLNHHTYTGDDDIYFTPSGGVSFTITSQVRIRSYLDTTVTVETSAGTFGPVTSSSSGTWQWTTVSCSGTLTKITIRRVNGANLSGIEIDGILLVNSGITPATNVPSIASTVRASASSGFSIVSYNGTGANATFGHGLNAAPEFVIVKTRTSGSINWTVWHEAIAATDYLTLNTSNAKGTAAAVWNSTAPTSSVINVGTDVGTNKSGDNYIAYCFAPVAGYSAMGSYTGNGSSDGPFIHTGFRPAFLIIKNAAQANSWFIMDTTRNTYNVVGNYLLAESSAAETSNSWVDILSNGFKIRSTATGNNNSGIQNLYIAFAENPFQANGGLAR